MLTGTQIIDNIYDAVLSEKPIKDILVNVSYCTSIQKRVINDFYKVVQYYKNNQSSAPKYVQRSKLVSSVIGGATAGAIGMFFPDPETISMAGLFWGTTGLTAGGILGYVAEHYGGLVKSAFEDLNNHKDPTCIEYVENARQKAKEDLLYINSPKGQQALEDSKVLKENLQKGLEAMVQQN